MIVDAHSSVGRAMELVLGVASVAAVALDLNPNVGVWRHRTGWGLRQAFAGKGNSGKETTKE